MSKTIDDILGPEPKSAKTVDDILGPPPTQPKAAAPAPYTGPSFVATDKEKGATGLMWDKFRTSDIGRGLFGPTDAEQRMIDAGTMAGPPGNQPGILPIAERSPFLMDIPGITAGQVAEKAASIPALAKPLETVAKGIDYGTRGLYAYWVAQFAASQPQRYKDITDRFKRGDNSGAMKAIGEDLLDTMFNAGMAHGILSGIVKRPEKVKGWADLSDEEKADFLKEMKYRVKNKLPLPLPTKEESNASQVQKAAAVHGNVRSQPQPASGVPQQKGGAGVQPQAQQVAKEAQVPLSEGHLKMAESMWENATGEGREKLGGGEKYSSMGWKDLTEEEQAKAASRMGIRPDTKVPPELQPQKAPKAQKKPQLDPEHEKMLEIERGNVDVPVDVVSKEEMDEMGNNPFAKGLKDAIDRNVATIDRKNKRIVINPNNLTKWLAGIPKSQQQMAMSSLVGEEYIHLHTDDAAAEAYWKNMTGLEQSIVKRRYGADAPGMNDVLWGHEALRFRMQQLARMTPREIAEASGREKWTLKGLTLVETAVRGVREAMGTKASSESKAILDTIQKNIKIGKDAIGATHPGAIDKKIQDYAEKEAQELDKQAEMYESGGEVDAANEMRARAAELRSKTGEQHFPAAYNKQQYSDEDLHRYYELKSEQAQLSKSGRILVNGQFSPEWSSNMREFETLRNKYGGMPPAQPENIPGARPKRRKEDTVHQLGFTLPGMGTAETKYDPEKGFSRDVAPETPLSERGTPEAVKFPERPSGQALEDIATTWVKDRLGAATEAAGAKAEAIESGTTAKKLGEPSIPKYKDFEAFVRKQNPLVKPGEMFELWQRLASKSFENMGGKELGEIAKNEFLSRPSLKAIERIEKVRTEEGDLLAAEKQSAKEGGRSVWNRSIPDKGPLEVVEKYRNREKEVADLEHQRDELKDLELHNPDDVQRLDEQIKDLKRQNREIQKEYEGAIKAQNWRSRVISALYRRMVKPVLEGSDAKLNRKDVVPEEIRHGAPHSYEDISNMTVPEMEKALRSDARRSSEDNQNITRRLMAILNPRSGSVHLVDVYPRGDELRVLDPVSPTRTHVPLSSILNRYKPLYTVLLDEPVRNFRQDFKNLPAYQRDFGLQSKKDTEEALSYSPTAIPASEFVQEIGGRIPQSESGHLQGPERRMVTEGVGEKEKGETTPLTDAESGALYQNLKGSIEPTSVEESLRGINPRTERQAFSALAKLSRNISNEYPFASPDELVSKLAQRISDAKKDSRNVADFHKKMAAEAAKKEPEKEGGENFPGAFGKDVSQEREIAKGLDDAIYRLGNAYRADVEDAFPQLEHIREQIAQMPPGSVEKASQKAEEEAVLGKSDIKLTPNEQKFYEQLNNLYADAVDKYDTLKQINPDAKHPNPREYWPRMLKDQNNIFNRVLRGSKSSVTEGTLLSKRSWFTRPRTIRAITDDDGNRHVVAITDSGRMIAYDNNKGTDMGKYAFGDVKRRQQLLDKELEPINKEVNQLSDNLELLTGSRARAAASKTKIRNISRRLAELEMERDAVLAKYPIDTLEQRTWVDKNGKQWKLGEATTSEIESNMNVRFHKNAYPTLLAMNLKLNQMLRSEHFLEEFKKSPEFQQIASVGDQPGRPTDWKLTKVPQLRGIFFEPRTADVLDQFEERSIGHEANAYTAINRLLMNAVFFDNPFLHAPNLANWWFSSRGGMAWLRPSAYPQMLRSFARAWHDVTTKSPDYSNYLRMGTPLQYSRMRQFTDNVAKMAMDAVQQKTTGQKIANMLGYANPIKLSQALGHAATAGLHDILTLQLIHELEERGMSPQEALHKVSAVMPDYRVPARVIMDNKTGRFLSKYVMNNPNVFWFGAYHYNEGKAFANMAKGLVGKGPMTRGEALDKVMATAFLMAVAYPIVSDLLKKVTGKNIAFRPAGSLTMPTAVKDMITGQRSPSQVIPSFVTPSQAITAAASLMFNKNLVDQSGLPIYDWRQSKAQSALMTAKFAANALNPVQMYNDIANGKISWDDFFLNMAGIKKDYSNDPAHRLTSDAYDWAKRMSQSSDPHEKEIGTKLLNRFNQSAMEIYPPSVYRGLKQALADGYIQSAQREYNKLIAAGKTDAEIQRELKPDAHPISGLKEAEEDFYDSLDARQRAVYDTEMAKRQTIYDTYQELDRQ